MYGTVSVHSTTLWSILGASHMSGNIGQSAGWITRCRMYNGVEHLHHLEAVFDRLSESGIQLNISKCKFLKAKVGYFRFIVDKDGQTRLLRLQMHQNQKCYGTSEFFGLP